MAGQKWEQKSLPVFTSRTMSVKGDREFGNRAGVFKSPDFRK